MPVISRFYGITIKMYLLGKEHNPPHIHAIYGEYNGVLDIQNLELLEGDLPGKGLSMLKEWAAKHQAELLDIWNTQNFRTLPPLE
jgi:hypothetical protein